MSWKIVNLDLREKGEDKIRLMLRQAPPVKKFIHNYLVGRLQAHQQELENVREEDLRGVQEVIRELRTVLIFLHKGESRDERANYEQTQS